jgi:glycosyltransferase involved in cell wall biosynthesis
MERDVTAFPRGRLLFITGDAPFFVTHFILLAAFAQRSGFDVHVASPLDAKSGRNDALARRQIEKLGLTFHEISMRRANTNPLRELSMIREFAGLIGRIKPDVLHCLGLKPTLYAGAIARLRRLPAVFAVIGLGLPFMGQGLRAKLQRSLLQRGFAFAFANPKSRITVEHEEDRAVILKTADAAKITRLYGVGVDLTSFHPRKDDEYDPAASPVVMFAARLIEPKGVRDFVAAAERVKQRTIAARFVLQCQLDLSNPNAIPEDEVRAWHDKGIVEWWGSTTDMPNALRKADIFCFPTYYREGTPKVLLEAAATGLPIITSDLAGCHDVVKDGDNGLLVAPRNVHALEQALLRLLGDTAFRRQAGRRSREIAVERFAVDAFVSQSMGLYAEVLPAGTGSVSASPAPELVTD